MKIIPMSFPQENIIPLNFIYDNSGNEYGTDVLSIIFKNAYTNEKYVHQIKQPKIEIYIVKEEYRHEYLTMRDWERKSRCDVYQVNYATRWYEIRKILKKDKDFNAKMCPYVFGADVDIETWYLAEFTKQHPYDGEIKLSLAYLDIESDVVNGEGIRDYGKAPVNAVTYIDKFTSNVYTLALTVDNLPKVDKSHHQYQQIDDMRTSFYKQIEDFKTNIDGFIDELHTDFDETYGELTYNILLFEDERELHNTLWKIVHLSENDFIEAWNTPYDAQSLMERPNYIGMNSNDLIIDKRFKEQIQGYKPSVSYYEDRHFDAHKRKHKASFFIMPTFVDDLVFYAGIRAGRGKIPSLKLNVIAEKEIGDKKLDYSEVGNFKTFFYENFAKWLKYNIKDTLLLSGIGDKTKDIYIIYDKLFTKHTMYDTCFTTTKFVLNVFSKFIGERGFILGSNKNRGHRNKPKVNHRDIINKSTNMTFTETPNADTEFEEFDEFIFEFEDDTKETDEAEKDEKYDGAYVMNPEHITTTGHKIMGKDSKYVHDNVADLDVTSEYPSAATSCNMSNATFVGKLYVDDEDSINIPIYDMFEFKGSEEAKYKLDKSNFFLETLTTGSYLQLGELYLGLDGVDDMISGFENYMTGVN